MSTNRQTAGIIALVLGILGFGWIGVHKFMMGYNKYGIIMIVATLLTCGIAGVVFTIISIVEGIIYLTKSDAQFDMEYSGGNKPWF